MKQHSSSFITITVFSAVASALSFVYYLPFITQLSMLLWCVNTPCTRGSQPYLKLLKTTATAIPNSARSATKTYILLIEKSTLF